ncbi:acyl-CoA dehydrogenase family protein [Nitrobacter sp.]|uniref:acyl-CoA dehydrogenase family protein n=1 Tax=Nitrobacter sp. TaxID=29420 RepID=UPI0029CAB456|nr:acyl-CoA dehydrogenase family protein [Nitrobacter sp.]
MNRSHAPRQEETATAIRETTRRFAAERIAPLAARIDDEDRFPHALWPEMGALGLHGISVETEYGGLGLGYLEHLIACEEISRTSTAVGLSYGAHTNLCINQIRRWGTPDQKARYLPSLISGDQIGALAMSEADAGSDVISMRLRADAVAGGWQLNGTKYWITNGSVAGTLVVYAKTRLDAATKGISAFIVEKGWPGFTIGQRIDKLGMRGSPTAELVFQDCFVPAENLLGSVDGGIAVLMSGLDYERVVLSGVPIGLMQACLDIVLPHVRERHQFGRPIGRFQLIQAKVADIYIALNSARAYSHAVARAYDAGRTTRFDAAGAILLAGSNAMRVAGETVQALGGAGYARGSPAERLFRDAKLFGIGAGTNEIRRILIGRELIAV